MANLRIIVVLVIIVAWWQKDTLEDRALTQEGPFAKIAQSSSRAWLATALPSPAKKWISMRDQWLDEFFNPQQDFGPAGEHLPLRKERTISTTLTTKANPVPVPAPEDATPIAMPTKETTKIKERSNQDSTIDTSIQRILIVGDSMSGDIGLSLRQMAAKYKQKMGVEIQIVDSHRHSTGLVVPSYYNWPLELPPLLNKTAPQVVVFMVGANDGQSMRLENQKWVLPGSAEWANEYEKRAKQVLAVMPPTTKLVWLDLPPLRLKSLHEKTLMVNSAVKNALLTCKNCIYLETRSTFGGNSYVENTPNSMLRAKDGIHYSRSGSSIVASTIWSKIGLPLYD